jgi:hypothetical protein
MVLAKDAAAVLMVKEEEEEEEEKEVAGERVAYWYRSLRMTISQTTVVPVG